MGLINDDPPFRLRGLLFLSLTDVGKVGTRSATSDSGGGASATWTYGADVPCRVDPLGGAETVVAGRLDDRSTHKITVPVGTTVTTDDRFAVTGRGTFEITAVLDRAGADSLPLHAIEAG